jgi:uncharacterized membrane protein (Fun14 family)
VKPVTQKQALRRYMRMFIPAMVGYLIGLSATTAARIFFDPVPLWMSILALAVIVLPLIGFLFVWLRYAREADEFQQSQMLWGFAWAGCITAAGAFTVGFGQSLGLIASFDDYWYAVAFIMLQGLTVAVRGGRCLP